MELIIGIICLVIIFLTGAFNSADMRMAQHRTTLSRGNNEPPKWWPSQKHLVVVTVIFNWIMTLAALANCIWLITINHANYIINFVIIGVVCWIVGRFLGLELTSAIVESLGKRNGIDVMRECL